MKKTLLAILIASTILSCKKNDSSSPIVAKWYFKKDISIQTQVSNGSVISNDTTIYNDGSYLDFRSDSKVYAYYKSSNHYDTVNYTYSNNKVTINNLGYEVIADVLTLDNSNLTLHSIQFYNSNTIKNEGWTYLSK